MPRQSYVNKKSVNQMTEFPFLIHRTGQVSNINLHDHDFWEMVYVYSGRGFCLNAGEHFEFNSHQLILTPPFTTHEFESHDNTSHEQISLAIYPDFLKEASIARVQVNELLTRIEQTKGFIIDVPEVDILSVENSLETISQEFLFQRANYESVISLEIARLLIAIDRFLFEEQVSFPQFNDLPYVIHEAIRLIELRYHEIVDLENLLDHIHININTRYFIRLFKKHVGFAPIQYLNRVRIEKSCSLLFHSSLSISLVALDVGFGDLRFFNRQFKRFTGLTPKEFRANVKNDPKLIGQSNRFGFLDR